MSPLRNGPGDAAQVRATSFEKPWGGAPPPVVPSTFYDSVSAYDGGTPGAGCADAGGRSCGRWHVHVMARGGAFGTSKAGLANGQGREAPGRSYCFIKRRYGASSISEVRSTQVTAALLRARTGQLHRSKAGHPGFRHYPNLPLRW